MELPQVLLCALICHLLHRIQKAKEALFKMSIYIITYRTIVTHKEGHFIKC